MEVLAFFRYQEILYFQTTKGGKKKKMCQKKLCQVCQISESGYGNSWLQSLELECSDQDECKLRFSVSYRMYDCTVNMVKESLQRCTCKVQS